MCYSPRRSNFFKSVCTQTNLEPLDNKLKIHFYHRRSGIVIVSLSVCLSVCQYNNFLSFFSRCRSHTLEHTAVGCPVIPFTSGLPPASKDILLPQIISWCCMTGRLRFRRLSNGFCYFSHVKNFLIDWLIDWITFESPDVESSGLRVHV